MSASLLTAQFLLYDVVFIQCFLCFVDIAFSNGQSGGYLFLGNFVYTVSLECIYLIATGLFLGNLVYTVGVECIYFIATGLFLGNFVYTVSVECI